MQRLAVSAVDAAEPFVGIRLAINVKMSGIADFTVAPLRFQTYAALKRARGVIFR
jgi:hypothetical protein